MLCVFCVAQEIWHHFREGRDHRITFASYMVKMSFDIGIPRDKISIIVESF